MPLLIARRMPRVSLRRKSAGLARSSDAITDLLCYAVHRKILTAAQVVIFVPTCFTWTRYCLALVNAQNKERREKGRREEGTTKKRRKKQKKRERRCRHWEIYAGLFVARSVIFLIPRLMCTPRALPRDGQIIFQRFNRPFFSTPRDYNTEQSIFAVLVFAIAATHVCISGNCLIKWLAC